MMNYKLLLSGLTATTFASTSLLSGFAQAAPVLDEIIVTAEKREESIQDTPIAISAFTGDALDRAGAVDAFNLSDVVPNLHVGTEGARDAVFITIRGVAQTERRNAADPTTAFHIDGVYVPRMSGISAYFYDMERLEVLRGPQGTLYGRNSTAGVVNLITNKPDLEGFDAALDFSAGNYDLLTLKGMVNMPISDNVAARLAFIKNDRDGYRDNGPLVADGDDADELGIRAQLLWNISEDTSLLVGADRYERGGVGAVTANIGCPTCTLPVAPDPADTNPLNTEGFRDNEDTNFKLQFTHAFEGFDLFYLGSLRRHDRDYLIDNEGTAVFTAFVDETFESEAEAHEIRLSSTWDGPFQAMIGGFYLDETIDSQFAFKREHISGRQQCICFNDINFKVESQAVFFNSTFEINERLSLNAGVRWTRDEKNKGGINDPSNPTRGSHFIVTLNDAPAAPVFPRAEVSNPSWNETTYKIGLDWKVTDDTLLYFNHGTGYKSGGFNRGSSDPLRPSGAGNVANLIEYDPELITSYEVGVKTTFMDGRARVNAALFYYDYEDLQQGVVRDIGGIATNTTLNAAEATIYGAEFEGTFLLGETGSLDVSLGWLSTEFDEFVGLDDPLTPQQDNLDVSGNELINAPDFNTTITLVPLVWSVANGTITPRLQFHYESDAWVRPHNFPVDERESYTKTDLSLRYDAQDPKWYAEAWIRNAEDSEIRTFGDCGFSGGGLPASDCQAIYASPRTYGITFGYRYQ